MAEIVPTPKKPETVKEILEAIGLSPAIEIARLIQYGELSDRDKVKALETLLAYCEPKLASKQVQVSGSLDHRARYKSTIDLEQQTLWGDSYDEG